MHCHVFGPAWVFPYGAGRACTPSDAPKETLAAAHRFLGMSRTVIVQASCQSADTRATLDANAASATQRRQPIYRSAIGRGRAYEEFLGPLLDALAGKSAVR